jgi:hypothetical protein
VHLELFSERHEQLRSARLQRILTSSTWIPTPVRYTRLPAPRQQRETATMPAAVGSRNPKISRATRDSAPPAKKTKLAQSPATVRTNGLKALVNGTAAQKPTAKGGARPALVTSTWPTRSKRSS